MGKQKLELTWVGKEVRPRLEPRILLEDPELSYHAAERVSENDIFDNRLIFGDNLLALKALEQEFAGKVKCIFIDPPYNTGSAFTHYDDGLEHSIWLSMMRDRLELLRNLLSEDGSLWVTLDDNEAHYFKVMADEVFGRANFVMNIVWNHRKSVQNDVPLSLAHNHVLLYARNRASLQLNRRSADSVKFMNPDNDPMGPWVADPFDAPNVRPNLTYPIVNPNTGVTYMPPPGRCWRTTKEEFERFQKEGRIVFGKTGRAKPQLKRYLHEAESRGAAVKSWWDDIDTATEATRHLQSLEISFDTPKPEDLIELALHMGSQRGDLVLDSFAGSGTTGAVAHKMGRRWIMVELGEHCHTHIIPRLKKVIDGTDQGGISKAVGWKGGGGFRYYRLAPSLIAKDKYGNDVINPAYNAEMLAEAMCKFMGFRYAPSDTHFWQHGQSSENDFIFVTTQPLTVAYLRWLSEEVGPERSLLVCCTAFKGSADAYPNLTIKRIPKEVLGRCEFGRDDYSMAVANLECRLSNGEEGVSREDSRFSSTPSLFAEEED